ncbi:MAG TPA: rRNA maturation RNase YbeY [Anaerolineaceae bacterium]|nr:rRNA maturation RNase YbeY [Anaerolineaceae bacterium]
MLEISIPNRFRKQISLSGLQNAAEATLLACKRPVSDRIALRISTNRVLKEFNKRYRGMDEATDVLSFENEYDDPENGTHVLGDILISFEKAQEQSSTGGYPVEDELEMLLVHGVLHLCGYDHGEKDAFAKMTHLQDKILTGLGNPLQKSIHEID